MKNGKKLISCLVVFSLFFCSFSICFADSRKNYQLRVDREEFNNGPVLMEDMFSAEDNADLLYNAGLFNGTNQGYELERKATRTEGLVMFLRLLGKETTAEKLKYGCPFTDVPSWAKDYVGYAYSVGLTKGISSTEFGANQHISAQQYATFILRALEYKEGEDFTYETALTFLNFIEGTHYESEPSSFVRGDMVNMSINALSLDHQITKNSLAEYLDVGQPSVIISTKVDAPFHGACLKFTFRENDLFFKKNSAFRIIRCPSRLLFLSKQYEAANVKNARELYKILLWESPRTIKEQQEEPGLWQAFTHDVKEDDLFIFVGDAENLKYIGAIPCAYSRVYPNAEFDKEVILDVLFLKVVR